ncbi:tRNA (adenosine(37)-N6)-threonylcarbamoyltransferase complex dimerization subunit type 1 TsaB [Sulfurihydrogenibium subterraneum]|uniref:tRNA (adenosine(37)-N6)-threonylcarbamoyltransferase complex dimerization subunit type 1 TsaB n=1 Tax=Sulfurihydrogenibium subterraneum TaxID=171121 RepID=UPI00048C9CEB|nr:tRNA (adenosine(37)-N6)-threonylcarbamoyltransferase complex dimerization subunit type 1 TsaB [Sulfurihydrogenibium subterraneum]
MYLSIDTFSDNFGIAVIDEEKVYGYVDYLKPKPFSEILIVEIDNLFKTLQIEKQNLKGVMVNIGLGSNTGLRVGVITAKTLSYALNIPVYTYQTLDVIIYKYRHFCGNVVAVINIGKSRVAYKLKGQENYYIKTFEEFKEYIKTLKNTLVITKNLDIEGSTKLLTSLAVDGGFYCLNSKKEENPFFIEPIYHD